MLIKIEILKSLSNLRLLLLIIFISFNVTGKSQEVSITTGEVMDVSDMIPINTKYSYNLWQSIYSYEEINNNGNITAISFNVNTEIEPSKRWIKLYLKQVVSPEFENTDWNPGSLVYEGFLIVESNNNFAKILLDQPYYLENGSNLQISLQNSGAVLESDYLFGIYRGDGQQTLFSNSENEFVYQLRKMRIKPVVKIHFNGTYAYAGDAIYAPNGTEVNLANTPHYKGVWADLTTNWTPGNLAGSNPIVTVTQEQQYTLTLENGTSSTTTVSLNDNLTVFNTTKNTRYYLKDGQNISINSGVIGSYDYAKHYYIKLAPLDNENKASLVFNAMDLKDGDWLRVYDGSHIQPSTLIGEYSGSELPENIVSSAIDGYLILEVSFKWGSTSSFTVNTSSEGEDLQLYAAYPNTDYAVLKKNLDGGSFRMNTNTLRFVLDSRNPEQLKYNLIRVTDGYTLVFTQDTGPTYNLVSGINYVDLTFPGNAFSTGTYILEVISNNNDKKYLRINGVFTYQIIYD